MNILFRIEQAENGFLQVIFEEVLVAQLTYEMIANMNLNLKWIESFNKELFLERYGKDIVLYNYKKGNYMFQLSSFFEEI